MKENAGASMFGRSQNFIELQRQIDDLRIKIHEIEDSKFKYTPNLSWEDQLNLLHTALFGWPMDHLTPKDKLFQIGNIHEAAVMIMNSLRFRWDIRDKVAILEYDKWVCTEYLDLKIWINLHDGHVSFGVLRDDWEINEANYMNGILKAGDTMIDIGANIGVFSLQAARAVGPSGQVHAFEPNTEVGKMLKRSIKENNFEDRCFVYDVGLGNCNEPATLNFLANSNNIGAAFVSNRNDGRGMPIELCTLDSFKFNKRVSFVKIDVEGFECQVLDGARRTLTEHRPVVIAEHFPSALRRAGGTNGVELVRRWIDLKYRVYEFQDGENGKEINDENVADFENIIAPINVLCVPIV